MKKRLQGLVAGVLIGAMLTSGVVLAANTTTLYDVIANGIKIIIDGQKLNPTDVNGNKVEPFIYNGTTYLPVRAVADALGKAVYWDGPNYTVYLGQVPYDLEYPTVTINDVDNISDKISYFKTVSSDKLTDNYGNTYSYANYDHAATTGCSFQTLLNMKYSKFKCVLYVPKGCTSDYTTRVLIKTDGKVVYTSPEITKTSTPITVDVNIKGCNDFQIEFSEGSKKLGYIAEAGFYQ
ncbi:MAG: stalk domain-containing protein [Clostridia bacterium]|nr:stalk domain-containing protein [Clostridia bacterium]